jgi:CRP-like cAMP-binding protein
MDQLFLLFNHYGPLPDDLVEYIQSVLKRSAVKKGHFFLKKGEVQRTITFIEKGLVRGFKLRGNREMTSWFMKGGDIFVSVRSFFKQLPAKESIQAMKDCIVYSITIEQYRHILKKWPEFNLHRAEILEKYYIDADEREDMRQQPAFERFCFLMDHHPELLLDIDDYLLASYLSMTERMYGNVKSEYAKGRRSNSDD